MSPLLSGKMLVSYAKKKKTILHMGYLILEDFIFFSVNTKKCCGLVFGVLAYGVVTLGPVVHTKES